MAFLVDDGTGLPSANAYISIEFFRSYHDDRGNANSSILDPAVQQAIVRATDYIDRRFKSSFIGIRHKVDQALEWPRLSAFYQDGRAALAIPIEVKQATAEYALKAVTASLAPDPVYDETNAPIIEREIQVGPIKERYYFGNYGAKIQFHKYPLADSLLKELVYKGQYLNRV